MRNHLFCNGIALDGIGKTIKKTRQINNNKSLLPCFSSFTGILLTLRLSTLKKDCTLFI